MATTGGSATLTTLCVYGEIFGATRRLNLIVCDKCTRLAGVYQSLSFLTRSFIAFCSLVLLPNLTVRLLFNLCAAGICCCTAITPAGACVWPIHTVRPEGKH